MNSKSKQAILNIKLKKGNLGYNVKSFLDSNNGDDYNQLVQHFVEKYDNCLFMKSFNDILQKTSISFSNNPQKSLLWFSLIVVNYKEKINEFILHKNNFERYVLIGNYDKAQKELDYIENNISCSLWSLKNKILLFNLKKENLSEMIDQLDLGESVKVFAQLYSDYINETKDFNQYIKIINANSSYLTNGLSDFFIYYFGAKKTIGNTNLTNIFTYASLLSIIDIFVLIKEIFHEYVSNNIYNNYFYKSISILNDLDDDEIHTIFSYINNIDVEPSDATNEVINCFDTEQYIELITHVIYSVKNNKIIPSYLYLASMTGAIIDYDFHELENCLLKDILVNIKNIIFCDTINVLNNSLKQLINIFRKIKWFSLEIPILEIFNIYSGNTNINITERCYYNDDFIVYNELIFGETIPVFPESIIRFKEDDSVNIEKLFQGRTKPVFEIAKNYINYYLSLRKKDFLIAKKELCNIILNYEFAIFRFNPCELKDDIVNDIEVKDEINIYNLILIYKIKELSEYRETALRNIFYEYEIKYPLDINSVDLDENIKNYFLGEICTIDALSALYMIFQNANEVENYRIKICKYLINNHTDESSKYSNEISHILKEQEIRNLKQTVDSSKLCVNTLEIKQKLYEQIRNLVNEFYNTSKTEYEFVEYDCPYATVTNYNTMNVMAPARWVLIDKMYTLFAKEFCFGIGGLDTYLSTRVRHGTFQNTITKVIKENYLYDTDNNFFKPLIEKNLVSNEIKSRIADFSNKVDSYIEYLTNVVFKVFIESFIDGAQFNYNFTYDDLLYFSQYMSKYIVNDANEFSSMISDCIVDKTNTYLGIIRDIVLEELKENLIKELETLGTDVKCLCKNDTVYTNISDKISRCCTNIQTQIDDIKKWFFLSKSIPMDNYDWEQLINVLFNTLKQQFDKFQVLTVKRDIKSKSKLKGETFVHFYDILLILFTNAIIHSEFDNIKDLNVSLNIEESDSQIVITVGNNISNIADHDKIESEVKRLNNIYNNKDYFTMNSRKEGGMGLIKIMDILFCVMNVGEDYKIHYKREEFEVSITIKKEGVLFDK
ncbi:MAG: hypothetical protein NC397_07315 [Clostridium sp.]|nr:hypothetical protein [Clostridium sp.]